MQAKLTSVPSSQAYVPADLTKRILASLIDGVLYFILSTAALIPGVLYGLLKDGFFDGRSVGKKVMGIRVIDVTTGQPCTFKASAIRHLLNVIPCVNGLYALVEVVMVITQSDRRRFGDRWANTMVIDG